MSSNEVKGKARQTAMSAAELLDVVKRTAQAQLASQVPTVANALDSSFDKAAKGLTDTLDTIDRSTAKEQAELLKAYKSFLQKQTEIIERRVASMKERESKARGS